MHPVQPRRTIRELIAELARLEEARRWPSADAPDDGQPGSPQPDPLELARREREVIAELRRHRSGL